MSLADEARTVRDRIEVRLRELEPLVREYEELEQLAAEMGLGNHRPAAAPRRAQRPRTSSSRVAQLRKQRVERASEAKRKALAAGDGELSERVLVAVRSDPSKTVGEYAVMLEVATTALYRPVRELTTRGALVKRGRKLFPA